MPQSNHLNKILNKKINKFTRLSLKYLIFKIKKRSLVIKLNIKNLIKTSYFNFNHNCVRRIRFLLKNNNPPRHGQVSYQILEYHSQKVKLSIHSMRCLKKISRTLYNTTLLKKKIN